MSALQSLPITEMLQRGSIQDVDVLRLKAALHTDCVISADEAEALFTLNETCPLQDPAWADFYVDALTDYLVNQVEPEGYLTAEEAKRFASRIAPDGIVARKSELDLLVNVLDKSRWSPVSLSRLALQQVKRAVVEGDGPLRESHPGQQGAIRECEVELVRRILYAFGGEGSVAITRPEAEVLFDINDNIRDPQSNAAWTDLFVKAVTNVVMAASGQAVPTREEALPPRCLADGGEGRAVAAGPALGHGFLEHRRCRGRLSGAIRRRARPRAARAAAHRDHHQRRDPAGRGGVAVRADRP